MSKNGTLKTVSGIVVLIAALIGISVTFGLLPWVSQAEFKPYREGVDKRLERIDRNIDDIHKIFFPKPHRRFE